MVREETRTGARSYDILLNLSGADADRDADEHAISLAASIASWAVRTGAPISVRASGFGVRTERGNSRTHLVGILDALAMIDLDSSVERAAIPVETFRGGSVIAIHSAGVDPSVAPAGAAHLRAEDLDRLAIVPGDAEGGAS